MFAGEAPADDTGLALGEGDAGLGAPEAAPEAEDGAIKNEDNAAGECDAQIRQFYFILFFLYFRRK